MTTEMNDNMTRPLKVSSEWVLRGNMFRLFLLRSNICSTVCRI